MVKWGGLKKMGDCKLVRQLVNLDCLMIVL